MKALLHTAALLLATVAATVPMDALAGSRTQLRNICRFKGQEENTLRGIGLVVGLNGTGEANDPATMRALARSMDLLGSPVSTTGQIDQQALDALRKVKNAALVMVTATVPATGARRGDKLNCVVSAINGKSLEGGQLAFAALQGPNTADKRVFGLCSGRLQIDNEKVPTVAVVHDGCQMQQDVFTPFHRDGYLTLVLDKNHAGIYTAYQVAEEIRKDYYRFLGAIGKGSNYEDLALQFVRAVDGSNIVVKIPEVYENDPVAYAYDLLEISINEAEPEARVVINSAAETIVISGDIEIGDAVVMHRNLVVEATGRSEFASVDQGDHSKPKLDRLVQALSDLKVPTKDIIEIIRALERDSKLHGKLIIE